MSIDDRDGSVISAAAPAAGSVLRKGGSVLTKGRRSIASRYCSPGTAELALIGVFVVLYVAFVLRSATVIGGRTTFTLVDDAMISMRYGRNLAEGNGLVYNPGEQVEGYTNLLWTLIMAGVHTVVRDERRTALVVSLIGVGVLIGQLVLARNMVRRATAAAWAPTLAVLALGSSFALVFWTLRGMEVGLIGLLLLGAIAVVHLTPSWSVRRRAATVVALSALAVTTRDDALVLAVVVCAQLVWSVPRDRRRQLALWVGAALAAVIAARWSLRWLMYGELLPNTYVLKVGGMSRTELVRRGAAAMAYTASFGLAVPLALALAAVRSSALARTCVSVVCAQVAYSVVVGGDAWEHFGFANRFVATVTAPLVIAAVLGLVALHRNEVAPRERWIGLGLLGSAAAVLMFGARASEHYRLGDGGQVEATLRCAMLVIAAMAFGLASRRVAAAVLAGTLVLAGNVLPLRSWLSDGHATQATDDEWAAYGLALRGATEPEAVIAASGIGNLGYFADRPIADILGKIDPVIVNGAPHLDRWMVPGHTKWDYGHTIGDLQPDVIAQLFAPTAEDIEYLRSLGYRRVGPITFVRDDAAIVGAAELQHAVDLAS